MTTLRDALIERLARMLYAAMVAGASPDERAAIERLDGLTGTALHEARRAARIAFALRIT
jgi:hypothetical protein